MVRRVSTLLLVLIFVTYPVAVQADPLTLQSFFELVVLGCVLYYADLYTDCKVLVRFWLRGQYWFFGANLFGNLLSSLTLASASFLLLPAYMNQGSDSHWFEPDCICIFQLLAGIAGLLQLPVLFMTLRCICKWQKPEGFYMPLTRGIETVESTISTFVQGYALVWDTSLDSSEERDLQISVLISLLSLANSLTLMDKPEAHDRKDDIDSAKIKSMFSFDFLIVIFFRMSEVILSFGSLFLFQLIARPYGIFIVLGSMYFFNFCYVMWGQCDNFGGDNCCTSLMFSAGVAIPMSLYCTRPLTYKHTMDAMYEFTEHKVVYFFMRCVLVVIMAVTSYAMAGSAQQVWETWTEYNRSAIYMAYAVLAAAIVYPMLFLTIWCKYGATTASFCEDEEDEDDEEYVE